MSLREYVEERSVPIPFCGCWLWLLSFGSHGYGNATTPQNRVTTAHRVAYAAFKGPIPRGRLVQHSCDQKWCVNPDHLSIGTDKTNAVDKQRKGRAAKRLTPAIVLEIRNRADSGARYSLLAAEYGVDPALVSRIARREIWRHI